MNKHIILFYLLLCSLKLYAQSSQYHIEGKVDPKYNAALTTLFTFTGNVIRSVDSTYVKNGSFHFKGPEYLYEKSIISIGNYPDTVLSAELLLERGEIAVEMKHKSEVYSPLVLEYRQYLDSCAILQKRIKARDKEEEMKQALQDLYRYKFEFKKKHVNNGMGREIFLRESQFMDDPYFIKLYDMLTTRDKSREDVKSSYTSRQKRIKQQFLAGKQFADFTLEKPSGEETRIADFVGKHELLFLDFWASWCGPCRAQEPHLIKLHQKYKDKGFQIVRISLDTNKDSWLSILKKNETSWPELCIKSKEDDKRIRELYNIAGIPIGFLIDKSGKIIYVINAWQHLEMFLNAQFKN